MSATSEATVPPALVSDLYTHLGRALQVLVAMPRHVDKGFDPSTIVNQDLNDFETYQRVIETTADVSLDAARSTVMSAIQAYFAACAIHRMARPEREPHA